MFGLPMLLQDVDRIFTRHHWLGSFVLPLGTPSPPDRQHGGMRTGVAYMALWQRLAIWRLAAGFGPGDRAAAKPTSTAIKLANTILGTVNKPCVKCIKSRIRVRIRVQVCTF